jgi:hypothetical protein
MLRVIKIVIRFMADISLMISIYRLSLISNKKPLIKLLMKGFSMVFLPGRNRLA